ncbi:MAG: MAPEG family protein [Polyangiaceae bacterium]|jgi:microsomal prostaglandin-E synthase 1
MQSLATNPAFQAYAAMAIVLSLNMLVLWAYSGAVRGKTKTTPNTEDARGGRAVVEVEPPEVARVLRAHRNATANIVPFAILGLVYVLAGASGMTAAIVFGAFTAARLGHSWAYLGGKQPWRSMAFGVGGLTTLVLIGLIVKALVVSA